MAAAAGSSATRSNAEVSGQEPGAAESIAASR